MRFGEVVTNITANGKACGVTANKPYTLEINGKNYAVVKGENVFEI